MYILYLDNIMHYFKFDNLMKTGIHVQKQEYNVKTF